MTESPGDSTLSPSPELKVTSQALVRSLAVRTGLRIRDDEVAQVATILDEYLGYVSAVDAVDLDFGSGLPLGFNLTDWLAATPRDIPPSSGSST